MSLFHFKRILFLFAAVFMLGSLSSCEKKPFDKRNKYLGDWTFEVSDTSF